MKQPPHTGTARPVLVWPHPALHTQAAPVGRFDAVLAQLVDDLFATMYAEEGIGLAANQVGVLQQALVIDLDPDGQRAQDPALDAELRADNFGGPVALINPRIVARRGTIAWKEGCLSVPGITETVQRSAEVDVVAEDVAGSPIFLTARGLFAVCIQHEMDHLQGRVFVEYLSQLKRDTIRRKMVRLQGAGQKRAAG